MPPIIKFFSINRIIKNSLLLVSVFIFGICYSQNSLENNSYEVLTNYLDNQSSDNKIYYEYLNALTNKAKSDNNLEHLFYAKSKYIQHSSTISQKLKHAESFLEIAQNSNNLRYIGLAYNKLSLIYYIERDFEQSLIYELKAEQHLEQTNDLYNLNKSKYGLGVIYYYLGDYEKAISFFTESSKYFQSEKSYNSLWGYINAIEYLAKSYIALGKHVEAIEQINSLKVDILKLKKQHYDIEIAYINLLLGQCYSEQQKYKASSDLILGSLKIIEENEDSVNLHLAYLYLGINLFETNKKEEAIEYFKKIDLLYLKEGYSDLNFLETYKYLIKYYKENNDLKNQLFYTERLLQITNELQQKNKSLSNILLTKYETTKIESNREDLIEELKKQETRKLYIIIVLAIAIFGSLVYYILRKSRTNSSPSPENDVVKKPKVVEKEESIKKVNIPVEKPIDTDQSFVFDQLVLKSIEYDKKVVSKDKTQEILLKLDQFEKSMEYLNPSLTLLSLAKDFETNSKYLSEVINVEKKLNFSVYINQLRINYALEELKKNKRIRKFTINALANEFGFGSSRSFSEAFFKQTGVKPSIYIANLDKKVEK